MFILNFVDVDRKLIKQLCLHRIPNKGEIVTFSDHSTEYIVDNILHIYEQQQHNDYDYIYIILKNYKSLLTY